MWLVESAGNWEWGTSRISRGWPPPSWKRLTELCWHKPSDTSLNGNIDELDLLMHILQVEGTNDRVPASESFQQLVLRIHVVDPVNSDMWRESRFRALSRQDWHSETLRLEGIQNWRANIPTTLRRSQRFQGPKAMQKHVLRWPSHPWSRRPPCPFRSEKLTKCFDGCEDYSVISCWCWCSEPLVNFIWRSDSIFKWKSVPGFSTGISAAHVVVIIWSLTAYKGRLRTWWSVYSSDAIVVHYGRVFRAATVEKSDWRPLQAFNSDDDWSSSNGNLTYVTNSCSSKLPSHLPTICCPPIGWPTWLSLRRTPCSATWRRCWSFSYIIVRIKLCWDIDIRPPRYLKFYAAKLVILDTQCVHKARLRKNKDQPAYWLFRGTGTHILPSAAYCGCMPPPRGMAPCLLRSQSWCTVWMLTIGPGLPSCGNQHPHSLPIKTHQAVTSDFNPIQ